MLNFTLFEFNSVIEVKSVQIGLSYFVTTFHQTQHGWHIPFTVEHSVCVIQIRCVQINRM